jgi:hypothetical protein
MSYLVCSYTYGPDSAEESFATSELFAEAVACTRRSGDQFVAFHLQNSAGVHALSLGDIPAARAHLEAAAQAMQAVGDASQHVRVNLGWVLRVEGDLGAARPMFTAGLRGSVRTGERIGIGYASLGLACLAGDLGDWHRAAVLHGVAQAFLDRNGQRWEELEASYRRDSLDQVRAHLAQEQFERAYAGGMALNSDDALNLASGKAGLSSDQRQ